MAKFVVKKGRKLKAQKIEQVLLKHLDMKELVSQHILDIGCGTGEIISYFSKNNNTTYAVDVYDQVKRTSNIDHFQLVETEKLPFEDETFDVIFSNHVIEHVSSQKLHMQEIHRCLKVNGVCYFATPNKNFLVEPHHRIPFIHYFGDVVFHKLLKLFGVYEEELQLLSYGSMKKAFRNNQFDFTEYTAEILKNPDQYHLESRMFKFVPIRVINWFLLFIPTNIFVLVKK